MPRLARSELLTSPIVNSKNCPVCNHPQRAEIENLIISISPSNPLLTLEAIADAYNIDQQSLKVHALMHTPLALDYSLQANFATTPPDNTETLLVADTDLPAGSPPASEIPPTEGVETTGGVSDPSPLTPNEVRQLGASALPNSATYQLAMRDRMTDKINLREGDMLLAAANEMLTTLTTLGRRLKSMASATDEMADARLVNYATGPMVNLYIGTSSELRKHIQAINELNSSVNGSKDQASEGLKALAAAIAGSATSPVNQDEDVFPE